MKVNLYRLKQDEEQNLVLFKEKELNYLSESDNITNPEQFVTMINELFQLHEQAEEYVYMLALNQRNLPAGVFEISHGSMDSSYINARELFRKALLCNASKIMICHNHPSGNVDPSIADIEITEKIKEAGDLIGMPLLDHIIIGGEKKYYSFFGKSNGN